MLQKCLSLMPRVVQVVKKSISTGLTSGEVVDKQIVIDGEIWTVEEQIVCLFHCLIVNVHRHVVYIGEGECDAVNDSMFACKIWCIEQCKMLICCMEAGNDTFLKVEERDQSRLGLFEVSSHSLEFSAEYSDQIPHSE